MQPTRTQLAAAFALVLGTGAAVGSAIALAGDASTATRLVAGLAVLAGMGLGLALRGYLRPSGDMASPNGCWPT